MNIRSSCLLAYRATIPEVALSPNAGGEAAQLQGLPPYEMVFRKEVLRL
jgi:hypothetical protein